MLPSCAPGPTCFVIARGGLIPQRNSLCMTALSPLARPCSQGTFSENRHGGGRDNLPKGPGKAWFPTLKSLFSDCLFVTR